MPALGFYRELVPLSLTKHKNLHMKSSPAGYTFAQSTVSVPLAGVEFMEAAREFPIVFVKSENERIVPIAVLGIQVHSNLFVDHDGKWRAQYMPAYLRRYPFIPAQENAQEESTVWIDESYDGLSNSEGELLIDSQGNKTEKLEEIIQFLQGCHAEYLRTEGFGKLLTTLGLLQPLSAKIETADGEQHRLTGFYVVDEQKLAAIDADEIVRLFRSGALAWIHAHLVSVKNIGKMVDLLPKKAFQDQ